ncbi:MAG: SDR family NAD(P)-dependent oxidoreductase [Pseudomonadota bacterium]
MNILITGAAGGFGELIVTGLVGADHTVVGSVRDPNGRNAGKVAKLKELGADVVEIDVTNDASVAAGVAAATEKLGQIDVLINNAGVGVHGLAENFSIDDMKRVFDINVYGVQRMTREVLPAMRERHSGLILNISSLLGRMVMPFYGPYNASKWAVEALTENYRVELSGFGVDVAIIEPGGFPTAFMDNLIHPSNPDRNEGYGEMAGAPDAAFAGFQEFLKSNPQQNPQLVADAVVSVIGMAPGTRPFRTEVDKIGMGDAIKGLNGTLEQIMNGVYSNMGMEGMLKLNTAA